MIIFLRLLALAALLLLWWLAALLGGSNLIPTPMETAPRGARAVRGRADLRRDRRKPVGLRRRLPARGPSSAFRRALDGRFSPARADARIYVNALTATPRVAFIPLIIVLLGLGCEAKVAIISSAP